MDASTPTAGTGPPPDPAGPSVPRLPPRPTRMPELPEPGRARVRTAAGDRAGLRGWARRFGGPALRGLRRSRRRLRTRWQALRRPELDEAQAEGLAAGTGLLTGAAARTRAGVTLPCPVCAGEGESVVIDLIAHEVTWRCRSCGHRWVVVDLPSTPFDG